MYNKKSQHGITDHWPFNFQKGHVFWMVSSGSSRCRWRSWWFGRHGWPGRFFHGILDSCAQVTAVTAQPLMKNGSFTIPKSQSTTFCLHRDSCIQDVDHMCILQSCNLQANGLDFELAEKPTSAENVDIGYSRNSKFVDSCPIFGLMFLVFEISWIPVKAPKSREPKAVESCWEPETCLDGENMRKHHCPLVVSASLLGSSSAKLVMLSWFYPIVIIMLTLC